MVIILDLESVVVHNIYGKIIILLFMTIMSKELDSCHGKVAQTFSLRDV